MTGHVISGRGTRKGSLISLKASEVLNGKRAQNGIFVVTVLSLSRLTELSIPIT